MRILHISTRLILGGSQENTILSCEGQARLGHDVHLAFGPIYGPEGSLLERVQRFNRRCASGEETTRDSTACRPITTHVVPDLIRAIHPVRDHRCYRQLMRLIADVRPDIVHTHSSKAGILGRAAAWRIHTSGGVPFSDPAPPRASEGSNTGASSPEQTLRLDPRRMVGAAPAVVHTIHGPPFHRYQSWLLSRLYILSERYAARRCHMIVSVADAMTRQYVQNDIGRTDQYVTVRSGMETETFLYPQPGESREEARRTLGLSDDDFVIGTVARLAELKGHDDLLAALADDLRSDAAWKLLWVGDGWLRQRLINKAKALGLTVRELDREHPAIHLAGRTESPSPSHPLTPSPAHVVITGLVPPERVPTMIRAMDVLAHPSYREGLPRTVPQALLCGVCPVAYDVDGTGEVCRDMSTGRLIKAGEIAGLRAAIRWCFDEPMNRRALAERGREECRRAYSAEKMVDDLERVYHDARAKAEG